jgi:hypothetical protein
MVMKTCKHTKQGANTLPSSLTFFWSVDIQSQDCIETNEHTNIYLLLSTK